jgi:hypothetical protein
MAAPGKQVGFHGSGLRLLGWRFGLRIFGGLGRIFDFEELEVRSQGMNQFIQFTP